VSERSDEAIGGRERRRWRGWVVGLVLLVSAGTVMWWLGPLYGSRLCTLELAFATDPVTGEQVRGNCCSDGHYLDLLDRYPDWMVVAVRGPQEEDAPRTREQLALICPPF
jgi:hypothetical protein